MLWHDPYCALQRKNVPRCTVSVTGKRARLFLFPVLQTAILSGRYHLSNTYVPISARAPGPATLVEPFRGRQGVRKCRARVPLRPRGLSFALWGCGMSMSYSFHFFSFPFSNPKPAQPEGKAEKEMQME